MTRTLLIAPLALTLATPALAGPLGHHRGPVDPDKVMARADKALDHVDATDEQRATVKALLEDAIPQMQTYRSEAGVLREEIRAVFHEDEIDRVALEDARTDLVGLFDRASATMFDLFADLAEVFSEEQRDELQALREKRKAAWRARLGLNAD